MQIEFDPAKDQLNQEKHGLRLERARDFDWRGARILPDQRRDYGEPRSVAYGILDARLHVLVFTARADVIRVISLRRANRKEVRRLEEP